MSQIPQQANIASYFGVRNCNWIPQIVIGFRLLFKIELAYKQFKNELEFLSLPMRNLKARISIVSGIQEQVLKHWLPKLVDVIF